MRRGRCWLERREDDDMEHPFPILQAASSFVLMRMDLSTVSNGRLCQLERQKDFWIWFNQTLTN
jgi:hypothetical protein